jgi:pimeloyl-ACP methyl ester carboxylesterase
LIPPGPAVKPLLKRVALAFVVFALCWLLAGHLLSLPQNHPVPKPASRLAWERITASSKGRPTVCWYRKGTNGKAVIVAHGNGGDRNTMVARGEFLSGLGYGVIIPDLNGHGETPGRRKTFGREEAGDIRNCRAYLERQGIAEVYGIGVSLGAAAMVYACASGMKLDGLILESAYSDIATAVDNRLRKFFGPWGPKLSPLLLWQFPLYLGFPSADLSVVDRIDSIACPLFVLSGDKDWRTTLEDTRRVYARAAPPKRIWIVEGAGHVDLHALRREEYEERARAFLS